jgi:hypothetical protein
MELKSNSSVIEVPHPRNCCRNNPTLGVRRLTLVKGWNTEEVAQYAALVDLGQPDFIEIKVRPGGCVHSPLAGRAHSRRKLPVRGCRAQQSAHNAQHHRAPADGVLCPLTVLRCAVLRCAGRDVLRLQQRQPADAAERAVPCGGGGLWAGAVRCTRRCAGGKGTGSLSQVQLTTTCMRVVCAWVVQCDRQHTHRAPSNTQTACSSPRLQFAHPQCHL